MKLSELLEERFRADVRYRGEAYLKAERVAILRVTADHVFGIVQDGVEYETQLSRENGQLKMHCNCSAGSQTDASCKHVWAMILAVEEGGLLTGTLKPNYVPPFAAEQPNPRAFRGRAWEREDGDEDLASETDSASGADAGEFPFRAAMRPWEATLKELRRDMTSHDPLPTRPPRETEIFYEIDVPKSWEVEQLVVQTSQRQRRAGGQWGKLKPLRLRLGRLDDVEHDDDRRILAYLSGGTPERTSWHAQQTEQQSSVYRYRLPYELGVHVLPLMCATGRARLISGNKHGETALQWDDGSAWEFVLRVAWDDEDDQWRLEGHLERDGAMISMADVELLVPDGFVVSKTRGNRNSVYRLARFEDFGAYRWVPVLRGREPIAVPHREGQELVDRLLDMPTIPRLDLPDELRLEEVACEPAPHLILRTPRGARWQRERFQGEVMFDYLGTPVRGSSLRWAIVQRDKKRCLLRNRERESRAWSELQARGFRRLLDRGREGCDVEIAARDLGPAVRALMESGWRVEADGQHVHQPSELQFRVRSGIDWFDLYADVDFEGRSVSFPELLSALARGDGTIRLSDGSLGILPEEWARQYGLLAGLGVAEDDHVRFGSNQAALLDALLMTQPAVDYDERFTELRDKLRSFAGVTPAEEPQEFQGELREYQREGLGWLSFLQEFGFGGCLADDMGLGKTVQVLALLLERLRRAKRRLPSLVVVPKSLLFNWQQEGARFTPQLQVLEYTGLDRAELRKNFPKFDVILTTYGTLRRDVLSLKDVPFDYVILDEAQMIKNAASQVAKASRLLRANQRLALSGTPIENHLGDLWSIFEFLNPGMLGRSAVFRSYAADADGDEGRALLSRGLRPFILRRTKQQVASELPDKFEQTIHCHMGKEQRRLYNELRDHYRGSLMGLIQQQGLAKSKMHVLEALLRLRQAACHPALLDKSSPDDRSAKIDVLRPHLQELLDEGHKALVFSQFTSMLKIVRRHLDRHEITYEYLDGQTRNRKAHIERFQADPDCGVFLISLKAGGLGLNLTAADYVFLLDPWWNPAVETQAVDRAHRVGQTRQVFAYRLICQDTVEEKIAELQQRKRSLADAILEADQNLLREMSVEDLEVLFS